MSELNLIKTVLFNAQNLNEALTRLDELNILYTKSDIVCWYSLDNHDINFWPINSRKCPLAVSVNGEIQAYDDRVTFLAGKHDTVGTSVPAVSPETACQRPYTCPHCLKSLDDTSGCNIHKPSTESVDNINWHEPADRFDYDKAEIEWENHSNSLSTVRRTYPNIPLVDLLKHREILRTERRLKRSQAKGLSS
ncbi:hypothetical protein [Rheinheimera metallidurans]|uniref:hypothetical protein n=1 Tax=Rheinheimera metallidurans TaxID=2925781 RepID=UPI003002B8A4